MKNKKHNEQAVEIRLRAIQLHGIGAQTNTNTAEWKKKTRQQQND